MPLFIGFWGCLNFDTIIIIMIIVFPLSFLIYIIQLMQVVLGWVTVAERFLDWQLWPRIMPCVTKPFEKDFGCLCPMPRLHCIRHGAWVWVLKCRTSFWLV